MHKAFSNLKRRAIATLAVDVACFALLTLSIVAGGLGRIEVFDMIDDFVFLYLAWGIYFYGAHFRNNIELHEDLIQKVGEDYAARVTAELEAVGLRRMIYSKWFRRVGKEVWPNL